MPGMNSGVNVNDPTVIAAFRSALAHQGLIALLIFAVLGVAWVGVRAWLPPASPDGTASRSPGDVAEPAGRQLLRIGFGILWLFDGILQAQPKMAIGLPSQVIEPIAASSPRWVQHVVNWAGTTWSYHPLQAGASAVWIQVGIGVWMLAAARGPLSRLAGLAGAAWGLVVWVFGEAFGGIFTPGLTWLFGAPGAAGIYTVAGALIALPERAWHTPRLGRAVLAGMGLFLAGMAVLQAWPGRGYWQGLSHGQPGTLAGMTNTMAQTPQPGFLSSWVSAFTGFDEAHGFAVNLFVVAALAVIGAVFLTGRPRLIRPALAGFTLLCLADWVLVEDLGFLGGLGTDPNSMIPFVLVATGGYLALARVPSPAAAPVGAEATRPTAAGAEATAAAATGVGATAAAATGVGATAAAVAGSQPNARWARWRELVRPTVVRQLAAAASIRSVAALGALGLIILGAAPMAIAQANPNADPILAQAISGTSGALNYPAPGFTLTDQYGKVVTLASLRGKVVLLSFFDPVCTSDCPLIGLEFRYAAQLLGPASRHVELVGIALSPTYRSVAVLQAFDRQEGFAHVRNWLFLTGTLAQLRKVWRAYGMIAYDLPAGAMTAHNDQAFVIDRAGHIRQEFSTLPGPGTAATKSSFAVLLAGAAQQALKWP